MNTELLQNLLSSDIIWQILIALAMLLLFRSVPKETLDKLEKRAIETESNADDMAIKVLRWLNANKELLPTLLPETPTLPAPAQPTVTVNMPTSPDYTTTNGAHTTISLPPVSVETPHTIVRNFGATDSNFEKTISDTRRVIHVPTNTNVLFSNRDGAGKEYPYPSVNVHPSYGVQFDIAYTAGAWGFTLLETLVHNAAYKVRLEYSAQITGDKKDSSLEWLWHELEVNGKVTGANQGISNGVSVAEWGITGTGFPVMLTPRIRCQWASSGDESKINWQRIIITPVAANHVG